VPDPELHGHPTAAELLDAVRGFLAADIMDATQGQVRFHARIATNVLAMVERELSLAGPQSEEHAQALRGLGVRSEAELAQAIRNGTLDDRIDDVVAVVRATVRARLEVANPDHLRGLETA
jgi:hypothetical protein